MKEPTQATVKRLFAKSQNQCAFPQCSSPIVEDSGTISGIICHIRARSKGGPRYDAKQTPEERHGYSNLILLCSRHSKIIDSEPRTYTVDLLREIKDMWERNGPIELSRNQAATALRLLDDYRTIYISSAASVNISSAKEIHAKEVHIRTHGRNPKLIPPENSIASSLPHRNYTKHLIDRYHEFASLQPGRTDFKYQAIYSRVKKMFGAKWDLISLNSFPSLVLYLQKRIDETRQGKVNQSKGYRNYSTFDEYREKYGI